METRKHTYNGIDYWITVEPTILTDTKETTYFAYVSESEPKGLLYGELLRQSGQPVKFADSMTAFLNAQVIKEAELDKRK